MNRPCKITFHENSAPLIRELPERYYMNTDLVLGNGSGDEYFSDSPVGSIFVQNAFLIDFAPLVLRTRVGGTKEEDPIDFPLSTILFIEWFYGSDVPSPLKPWVRTERAGS